MAEAEQQYRMPGSQSMQHACKISIADDKPIMLDYWTESCDGNVVIGVRENGEKLIVKSEEEYTSPIAKIYRVDKEYLIITENSIYLTSDEIATRRLLS